MRDRVDGRELGVEPTCRMLSEHGCTIAPATYWAHGKGPPCARVVRDAELFIQIRGSMRRTTGSIGLATLRLSRPGAVSTSRGNRRLATPIGRR